jgi:hypothetical protein
VTGPPSSQDKDRLRRNSARVRELFWREWDPIGINAPDGGPKDEYDRYADRAYVMLMHEGRSAKEIADYLHYIASEHMGLGASQSGRDLAGAIADKLVALRSDFESSGQS